MVFTSYCAGFAEETWDVGVGVTCWDCNEKRDRKRTVEYLRKGNAFTLLQKSIIAACISALHYCWSHYLPWPHPSYIKNSQNHMQIMSLAQNIRSSWIREKRNPVNILSNTLKYVCIISNAGKKVPNANCKVHFKSDAAL